MDFTISYTGPGDRWVARVTPLNDLAAERMDYYWGYWTEPGDFSDLDAPDAERVCAQLKAEGFKFTRTGD